MRNSRHIFQATQTSSNPPAKTRPTNCINWVTSSAKAMRNISAATTPMMITLRRDAGGKPAASAPTTMALSAASMMSISTT